MTAPRPLTTTIEHLAPGRYRASLTHAGVTHICHGPTPWEALAACRARAESYGVGGDWEGIVVPRPRVTA